MYPGEEAVLEMVGACLKDLASSSLKLVKMEAEYLLDLVLSLVMQDLKNSSPRSKFSSSPLMCLLRVGCSIETEQEDLMRTERYVGFVI